MSRKERARSEFHEARDSLTRTHDDSHCKTPELSAERSRAQRNVQLGGVPVRRWRQLFPFAFHRRPPGRHGLRRVVAAGGARRVFGLLDFGVRAAVTRYIAQHHAKGDTAASSAIGSGAMLLFGLAAASPSCSRQCSRFSRPVLFNIPAELAGTAKVVLIVGGFTVATTLIGAVFGGIITGLERFDITAASRSRSPQYARSA